MNDDQKYERIVWLLEHFEDALMERIPTTGRSQHESVSLLPGPLWNEAFRELQRCLDRMRNQGRQRAVSFPGGSCSLGCARWHVMAWFVQVERRQTAVRQAIKKRNGKRGTVLVQDMQPLRHRDARQAKADAGVAWIVGEYDWESAAVQGGLAQVQKVRGKKLPVEAVKAAV